jgi:K+-transporting ATPase ATPase A chain
MKYHEYLQLAAFIFILILLTPILGTYMAKVFSGTRWRGLAPIYWLENAIYRLCGTDPQAQMSAREYAVALMSFNVLGLLVVFLIQVFQGYLPLNPEHLPGVPWSTALSTAVSFITNTNWQSYAGESTMSYLTQMTALNVQNFVSAATGMSVAVVLARGIAARSTDQLGSFWVDLTRSVIYVLLPISFVLAIVLVGQGVVQNFDSYVRFNTVEGAQQVLPMGPIASQEAIKMLGTNGGGYLNANSAHPFENPTPLTNFLEMLAMLALPAALTYTFGSLIGSRKHGWTLFGSMMVLFLGILAMALASETTWGVMEGKEVRFGTFNSILFGMITTSASCGAINALHSSFSPLTGGLAMLNMMLGEVIWGGAGAGLYGILLFTLMTVFLAGLMVGRTPEYLGKKIEVREMTMVILAILAPSAMILVGAGISLVLPAGLAGSSSAGPHGLSEILYAFTSAAANNGSAFAGLNANTPYYNIMLALTMFVGRFAIILPLLSVAGSLAAKKYSPPSIGTFEVDTPLFGALLIAVILIVGGLTFFPALSLGPIVEHFLLLQGRTF